MSFVLGKNVVLYGYNDGQWQPLVCGRDCSYTLETEEIEISQLGTGSFYAFKPVKHTATFTLDGLIVLDQSNTLSLADLRAFQMGKVPILLRYERVDENDNVYTEEATGYIISSGDNAPHNDIATFNLTIKASGVVAISFIHTNTEAGKMTRFEYTGIGGEVSFSNSVLIGKDIQVVTKDGIAFSRIITTGTPLNKEVKYTSSTGTIEFAMTVETGEEIVINYQSL